MLEQHLLAAGVKSSTQNAMQAHLHCRSAQAALPVKRCLGRVASCLHNCCIVGACSRATRSLGGQVCAATVPLCMGRVQGAPMQPGIQLQYICRALSQQSLNLQSLAVNPLCRRRTLAPSQRSVCSSRRGDRPAPGIAAAQLCLPASPAPRPAHSTPTDASSVSPGRRRCVMVGWYRSPAASPPGAPAAASAALLPLSSRACAPRLEPLSAGARREEPAAQVPRAA